MAAVWFSATPSSIIFTLVARNRPACPELAPFDQLRQLGPGHGSRSHQRRAHHAGRAAWPARGRAR